MKLIIYMSIIWKIYSKILDKIDDLIFFPLDKSGEFIAKKLGIDYKNNPKHANIYKIILTISIWMVFIIQLFVIGYTLSENQKQVDICKNMINIANSLNSSDKKIFYDYLSIIFNNQKYNISQFQFNFKFNNTNFTSH